MVAVEKSEPAADAPQDKKYLRIAYVRYLPADCNQPVFQPFQTPSVKDHEQKRYK